MPKYNVHLYTLYRVKFEDIEADDHLAAIKAAMLLDHTDASVIEHDDGCDPEAALVDVVGDEDFDESKDFDILEGEPHEASKFVRENALKLVRTLARMTKDEDIRDGEEYMADGNDEEVEALYSAISSAREILGLADPFDHDNPNKAR